MARKATTDWAAKQLDAGQKDHTFFDDTLPGFGLRVRFGGSRTWVVQYKIGGRHRRMVLGSAKALSPEKAWTLAMDVLSAVRQGTDVAAERIRKRSKVAHEFSGKPLRDYLGDKKKRLKPRSYAEIERHLLGHAKPLHKREVEAIKRSDIATLLRNIANNRGPFAANRVRVSLSGYFGWMIGEGLLEANPVLHTNKAGEDRPRERVLKDDELVAIWRVLGNDQYSSIVKLLILTGARRDEIGGLRWSEVDLENTRIVLPGARTKNGREHVIPLVPTSETIIAAQPRRNNPDGTPRDLVFGFGSIGWQYWSGSKRSLDERIAKGGTVIEDWRLHDFRRTVSTVMHDKLEVFPHIVEAVLAHVDGHRRGVAGVYNKATYDAGKRIALTKWADYVDALVNGRLPASNVVALHAQA